MQKLADITNYLNSILAPENFHDYSNNGLQVEASEEIHTIAFSVDACAETFELAIKSKADLLFVHHGISWGDGLKYFTGVTARRFALLFNNKLSLYGAHLPLDANHEFGNNAILSQYFNFADCTPAFPYHGQLIGFAGTLSKPQSLESIAKLLGRRLKISPDQVKIYPGKSNICKRLGIVSGGGASCATDCLENGCDTLITGETSHTDQIFIRDAGISLITAGHYATETTGPKAVMKLVSKQFPDVKCVWIDTPTYL